MKSASPGKDVARHHCSLNRSIFSVYATLIAGYWFPSGLLSYSSFMVKEFYPPLPHSEVGYYTGLLTGAFYLGRSSNSVPMSFLINRLGELALMMLTCCAGIIFPLILALSPSFWGAFFASLFYGFFNTDSLVAKVRLANILTTERNVYASSYMYGIWGISSVCSPFLSGTLSYAYDKYPLIGRLIPGLAAYPFLLPNIVTVLLNSFALAMVLLEYHSKSTLLTRRPEASIAPSGVTLTLLETPEMQSLPYILIEPRDRQGSDLGSSSSCRGEQRLIESDYEPSKQVPFHLDGETPCRSQPKNFLAYLRTNEAQVVCVMALFALAGVLRSSGFDLFPLLLMLPKAEGGYSMSTGGIGMVSAIQGLIMVLSSYLAPRITTRFGYRESTLGAILLSIPLYNILPYLVLLPAYYNLIALNIITGIGRQFVGSITFNSTLMLTNLCSSKKYLAQTSALCTSAHHFLLFICPSVTYSIFAWSATSGRKLLGLPCPFNLSVVFICYAIVSIPALSLVLRLRLERNFPVKSEL